MANQIINVGTTANDGTGDKVRDAFIKVNSNFAELYDEGGANITVNNPVTSTETTLDEALIDLNTGGGGSQTLAEVLVEGNITDGTDISISDGDKILLDNGANLKKGTTDAGLGGSKGIALRCAVDYELKWEAGRLYVMGGDGFTIREVSHNFTTTPTVTDDDDKGFVIDSRWILDNGNVYVCTDATTGAAVWELQDLGTIPTLQEVANVGNTLTDTNILFNSDFSNSEISINVDDGILLNNIDSDKMASIEQSALSISNYDGTNTTFLLEEGFSHTTSGIAQKLTFENITSEEEIIIPNASGTIALTSDITTPTLQEVLDNNHDLVDGNNFQGTDAGVDNTGTNVNALGQFAASSNTGNAINALGNGAGVDNTGNAVNALGQETAVENIGNDVNALGFRAGVNNAFNNVNLFGATAQADENGQTVLSKDGTIMARISTTDLTATRKYNLPDSSGTIALTSDIPSSSGIPHATAAGTDTYTATITGVAAYADADAYLIRFTNGNTTGATLNINSLGAKTLYRNNDGALIGGDIINGGEMLCIYNTSLNGFQVIGTAPNSLFAYVTNDDSVTLTKGMPVYAFGGTGDRMTVKRANNSADATSAQTVGLVLSISIAANQKGLIMIQGLLDGLSILPTSTWADGDAVYLGATAGTITNVKPYAPNHLVYLGVVTTASNGSAGRMYVRVQNGYELSEIHDIDLITNAPTNNQVLTYESSTDLWKNKSLGTILGYTPYRNVQTSQTVHTGTTAETVLFTATIPAGAFSSNDVIKVLFGANKTTALGTYSLRIRVNTTNTISGAPTIALYSGTATAQVNIVMRNFSLNGGNLYGIGGGNSAITDIVALGGALGSTTLNPANQFYIFATITLNNAGDSIIGNMLSISN